MTGTSASWTPERRAAQAAVMTGLNDKPEFAHKRNGWTEERRADKRAKMIALNADPAFQDKRRAAIADRVKRPQPLHPVVAGLFAEIREQRTTRQRVARPAGVGPDTISGWGRKHMPYLDLIDAALNVLGFELAIVPIGTRDATGFPTKKRPTGE